VGLVLLVHILGGRKYVREHGLPKGRQGLMHPSNQLALECVTLGKPTVLLE
jgi:hypothetical protein